MTDERLLELLLQAGAKEQGAGQGSAYRELTLTARLQQDMPDIHLSAFKRFAALVAASEREAIASACLKHIDEPQVMVLTKIDDTERSVVCRECSEIARFTDTAQTAHEPKPGPD